MNDNTESGRHPDLDGTIPWISHDERAQQRMIEHVIDRLNGEAALSQIQEDEFNSNLFDVLRQISEEEQRISQEKRALSCADRGD